MSETTAPDQVQWPGTIHCRWMNPDCQRGLVSVILPTFNRAPLLPDAMNSVRRQTYRPLELLVIDDGSTDETAEVVHDWQQQYRGEQGLSVRHLTQPNRGAPAARNLGLIESSGEYVQFLDSDDVLAPDKLKSHVACLQESPQLDYVWSNRRFIHHKDSDRFLAGSASESPCAEPIVVRKKALRRIPTNANVGLFRRRLCHQMGPWNEALERHQDWEYTVRVMHFQSEVCYLPAELYTVRLHDHGRISDLQRHKRRALRAKLKAAECAEEFARHLSGQSAGFTPYNQRLLGRYFRILRNSLTAVSWSHLQYAIAGMRRHMSPSFRRQF